MLQARWTHLNRKRSLLTRIQAVLLDGHFLVEHAARAGTGCFFNFNGTAGIWRRAAIEEGGGWQHDTLTEDLDLSYRSQLAGWKFAFAPQLEVAAELPSTLEAFRTQQRRWTRGSTQTLRKLTGVLLRAPITWRVRAEAFVHLGSNLAYLGLVLLSLLMPWASLARDRAALDWLVAIDWALLGAGTGALALFYAVGRRRAGRSAIGALLLHPAVMGLGIGMSVHNAAAAWSGLSVKGGEFVRTPKSGERDLWTSPAADGDGGSTQGLLLPLVANWRSRTAAPKAGSRLDSCWWISCGLCLQLVWGTVTAAQLGLWWALPFQVLFALSFGSVAALQLRDRWKSGDASAIDGSTARRRRRPAEITRRRWRDAS